MSGVHGIRYFIYFCRNFCKHDIIITSYMGMRRGIILFALCLTGMFRTMEAEVIDMINYTLNEKDGTATVSINNDYKGPFALVIRPTVFYETKEYVITEIESNAFQQNTTITSVEIMDGIKSIGHNAFANTNIISVSIPTSVASIGEYAFYGCSGLETAELGSGVTSIGRFAFADCFSLVFIALPNSVKTVGDRAFYQCRSLSVATLSPQMTSLEESVFEGNKALASIVIPDNIQTIGNRVFAHCPLLASVNFPKGLRGLGNSAFEACVALDSIVIPDNVMAIGERAFASCSGLQSISLESTRPELMNVGDSAFADIPESCIVHIPKGTDEFYAEGWYGLTVIFHFYTVIIEAIETDTAYRYSYSKQVTFQSPEKGYHAVRWTDENGEVLSLDRSYTLFLTSDIHLRVSLEMDRYNITFSGDSTDVGTLNSTNGIYTYFDIVEASASTYYGYRVANWTDNGNILSSENPYFFHPEKDMDIRVLFEKMKYEVKLSVNTGGRIKYETGIHERGDTTVLYEHEAELVLEAEALYGYHFKEWTDENGSVLSYDNSFTLSSVVNNLIVKAWFEPDMFNVFALPSAEQECDVAGGGSYAYGETVTLTAVPANPKDYGTVEWRDKNDSLIFTGDTFSFVLVSDTSIWATLVQERFYHVKLSAGTGGSITPATDSTFSRGELITVNVTADKGYHFERWTEKDWSLISADSSYIFAVTGDITAIARFAKDRYNVNVVYTGTGSGHAEGAEAHEPGMVKLKSIAEDGSWFTHWLSGDSIITEQHYDFLLTQDTTVYLNFEPDNGGYTVKALYNPAQGWTTGDGKFAYNGQAVFKAFARTGYRFVEWRQDGVPVSEQTEYAFAVEKALVLVAVFESDGSNDNNNVDDGNSGGVGNETLRPAEAKAYYTEGALHLVNLENQIITVTTVSGRKVLQFKAGSADKPYPVTLPAGMYILTAAGKGSMKFIVR
ncbi:hypothetical protein Barb6XT_01247 [Bacteroidales bacterium Barb6XT]|nr:hypothetical protein Barb6XT_01247 [Bacteroidales bacterium Barb6XT]